MLLDDCPSAEPEGYVYGAGLTSMKQGGNTTGYGTANPIRFADPSGLVLVDSDAGANHCRHVCTVDFTHTGPAWEDAPGYWDLNLTAGLGLVVTVGVQIEGADVVNDWHLDGGVGIGTGGVSITSGPMQTPVDGVSCQAGATIPVGTSPVGVAVQAGAGGAKLTPEKGDGELDSPFVEVGVGIGPGAAATCTVVATPGDVWDGIGRLLP